MAQTFARIDTELRQWVSRQHVFFVATAPSAGDGFVNCSPKGGDSLRIIDDRTLCYLDVVGSGVETIAHLNENGRIVLMLCAFEGPPRIVRFHGRGTVVPPTHPDFAEFAALFPPRPGVRSVVRIRAERISDSCGYGVPLMDFREDRKAMTLWAEKKGQEGLDAYQREHNASSLDGLPGVDWID